MAKLNHKGYTAKIEADPENPRFLKTVRGSGYLFESRDD